MGIVTSAGIPSKASEASSRSADINKGLDAQERAGVSTNFGPCNPQHVLLRFEYCKAGQYKVVVLLAYVSVLVGVVPFIAGIVTSSYQAASTLFSVPAYGIVALATSGFTVCLQLGYLLYCLYMLVIARKANLVWARRRRRLLFMMLTQLGCLFMATILTLVASAIALSRPCAWFTKAYAGMTFCRMVLYHTSTMLQLMDLHSICPWRMDVDPKGINRVFGHISGRQKEASLKLLQPESPMVLDLPLRYHWPKILILLILMVPTILLLWSHISLGNDLKQYAADLGANTRQECLDVLDSYTCDFQTGKNALYVVGALGIFSGFGLFLVLLFGCKRALGQESTSQYRLAKVAMACQMRIRAVGITVGSIMFAGLYFASIGNCTRSLFAWTTGVVAVQVVEGVFKVMEVYLFSPTIVNDAQLERLWMEEVLWSDTDSPDELAKHVNQHSIFCFETVIKLLYWSRLVYQDDVSNQKNDSLYNLETAMALYRMEQYEIIHEKSTDTKAILAWGPDCVLLVFRGTSTRENVKSDLRITRSILHHNHHIIKRVTDRLLRVHAGFHHAWSVNRLNESVLERITHIAAQRPHCKIYITGHSLGGALATLCSLDLAVWCTSCASNIVCYTFGAPRTGNQAFCKVFDALVPNCWRIINGQDVVSRRGSMFGAYKHCGNTAVIDKQGNLKVRPTFLERKIWNMPGSLNVVDHLLTSYVASLAKVLAIQLTRKAHHGGREGVVRIANHPVAGLVLAKNFNFYKPSAMATESSGSRGNGCNASPSGEGNQKEQLNEATSNGSCSEAGLQSGVDNGLLPPSCKERTAQARGDEAC